MRGIKDIIGKIAKVFFVLALVCLVSLIALSTLEICSRYLFDYSFTWSHEFSLLLLCWAVFLGFGKVVTDKEDIAVTFLVDKLKLKNKNWFKLLNDILLAITSGYMFFVTLTLVKTQIPRTTLIMGISEALYTLPLVLVLLLITLHALNNCFLLLMKMFNKQKLHIEKGGKKWLPE